ncbi:hypothetical protein ElyMa_006250900 [Elysia marginata]|uniref:Transposable element P transposase-like RNase H domain-containing protein n=1 Tax=Elysia marginata TaxID=1093978 RepID=A0AAV4HD28_9GAST|nr:hypothetical protein ElyMa_006250900 [Elysia marginata]
MPYAQTLAEAMKNVHVKPGICSNMMHLFEIKVSSMNAQERACAVVLDEVALKASLRYSTILWTMKSKASKILDSLAAHLNTQTKLSCSWLEASQVNGSSPFLIISQTAL